MKIKELLPIGTVVSLKNSKKRLMITGIKQMDTNDTTKEYDYYGVLYPEGHVGEDFQCLFDHENIAKIYFRGYEDEERTEFLDQLEKLSEDQKGDVMVKIRRKDCTDITEGKIKAVRSRGLDCPTMITVEYRVNGKSYEITESIKLRSEAIKLGFLPIGQRKVPIMGDTSVGSAALVNYNPNNPPEAYITKNIGRANI